MLILLIRESANKYPQKLRGQQKLRGKIALYKNVHAKQSRQFNQK